MRMINFHGIESLEIRDCFFGLAIIYPIHLNLFLKNKQTIKSSPARPQVEKCVVTSQNPQWTFYVQENKENCQYHLEQLVFY